MCGIIGYIGGRTAAPILLEGLQRLEYRGYDSAGIAVLDQQGQVAIRKSVGKVEALIASIGKSSPAGSVGIGHTRWATHGKPSDINAHPHTDCTDQVIVIHNGIVENYLALKAMLQAQGHSFKSQTDTEVIPHLIELYLRQGQPFEVAARQALCRLEGSHAILAIYAQEPEKILAARIGNAGGVVVGYGKDEMYLASDLPALLPYTQRVVFLDNREMANVAGPGAQYYTLDGQVVPKEPQQVAYDPIAAARGGYKHFMLKEIMEQPQSILDGLRGRIWFEPPSLDLEDFPYSAEELRSINRAILVGMGTSLHAAMVGRSFIEEIARLPAEVDNASEFRYRDPLIGPDTLIISVGQSGETVDTLAAMEEARRKGAKLLTICNVVGSQATRLADGVIYIRAGLEIGVCSTKTFTGSLTALYLLAAYLGWCRGILSDAQVEPLILDIAKIPHLMGEVLSKDADYEALAHQLFRFNNFLYLGRGINYPIALEGALKLKEVSYIHAEGYPAGEMKHGPIALIDEGMPVVAIALRDRWRDKMINNIEQLKARDGIVIAIATEGDEEIAAKADHVIYIPQASPLLNPILAVGPLQLLAYHIAVRRGCDVDQPRNLAKSVTVE